MFFPLILRRPWHLWVLGHWNLRACPREVPLYAYPHFTFNLGPATALQTLSEMELWSYLCIYPYVLLLTHRLGGLQSSDLNWLANYELHFIYLSLESTIFWPDQYTRSFHTKAKEPGDYRHQNFESSSCSFILVCTTSTSAETQYQKKTTTGKCALRLTASTLLQQASPRVKWETKFPFFPAQDWSKTWYCFIQGTV